MVKVDPTYNAVGDSVKAHGCGGRDEVLLVERTLVSEEKY